MRLYFEFEEKRREAEVIWPKNGSSIAVHVNDNELTDDLPGDLLFEIGRGNKVTYIIESADNKRLVALQKVIGYKLQELVN